VFSFASSGIYLVNDVQDVELDRAHPAKRNRPIAAGVVRPRLARAHRCEDTQVARPLLLVLSPVRVDALSHRDDHDVRALGIPT
jgi:hypothetical protein